MGCGCSGGAKAALKGVQKYEISDDPESREFLTEREALSAKSTRASHRKSGSSCRRTFTTAAPSRPCRCRFSSWASEASK